MKTAFSLNEQTYGLKLKGFFLNTITYLPWFIEKIPTVILYWCDEICSCGTLQNHDSTSVNDILTKKKKPFQIVIQNEILWWKDFKGHLLDHEEIMAVNGLPKRTKGNKIKTWFWDLIWFKICVELYSTRRKNIRATLTCTIFSDNSKSPRFFHAVSRRKARKFQIISASKCISHSKTIWDNLTFEGLL